MAKKLERKGYQESMADYPRIVSMTNYSPSTGTAAKVSRAPEQGNSSPLSTSTGTGSDAFSTEASSLTLAIFIISLIFIVFSTEIMSARLHTWMIHWYLRQHFEYIYLSINISVYLFIQVGVSSSIISTDSTILPTFQILYRFRQKNIVKEV